MAPTRHIPKLSQQRKQQHNRGANVRIGYCPPNKKETVQGLFSTSIKDMNLQQHSIRAGWTFEGRLRLFQAMRACIEPIGEKLKTRQNNNKITVLRVNNPIIFQTKNIQFSRKCCYIICTTSADYKHHLESLRVSSNELLTIECYKLYTKSSISAQLKVMWLKPCLI